MSQYITTNYQCHKCQKQYEFSEKKNFQGIRQFQCKHYILKFIKNLDNNAINYHVSIKCRKCSKKLDKSLFIANNKNMINFGANIHACCGNQINFGAFYSEQRLESVNKIQMQQNNLARSVVNFNMNGFDNNNQNMNNINQNNNMNIQKRFSGDINKNNNNFDNTFNNAKNINNNNNNFQNINFQNNNNNIQNNNNNFPNNNNNFQNNNNNFQNNNNNFQNNNNNFGNPNINFQNNMNMMNRNMNQNMNNMNNMNNQNMLFSNNNMIQNNQFRMNNFQNNNGMNNMNNMNNGMNVMNGMNNNNMQFSQVFNNNNTTHIQGQNIFDYNYLGGKTECFGQTVTFKFEFKQQLYQITAKNNRTFNDVLNEFLNYHPEIKSLLSMNQRYSFNGDSVDVNKTLFDLGIKSGSIVVIIWLGNN